MGETGKVNTKRLQNYIVCPGFTGSFYRQMFLQIGLYNLHRILFLIISDGKRLIHMNWTLCNKIS